MTAVVKLWSNASRGILVSADSRDRRWQSLEYACCGMRDAKPEVFLIARPALDFTETEERELARQIETITRKLAPQLLDQPGVGPHAAAQLVLSWSHRGRIDSEAAFARLAGAAPIPASSGKTIRYRLDRSGDRKLNRALHMILVTRKRTHPATIAYIERRMQEGKTRREANRCLKRYLARSLYRLLEHGPPMTA
jgi:transposase